ncbi:siphovirus ReqiPepy6 Gp37-like family protein [Solibaculum mannosilyticum]|uniref:Gp28/Gp37-like domain-containing protein n=1 Tax=Solibaculum mannosilyticum TaxID=2780922 RepID=A0A7I8D6L1_9FIRM|nr:siphovirus ReqiPepy6 Gp37-like family protein [Solibaculum mannosilyticum]BCI60853.1 hypothetical protein C12CBH8_14920 [Solibaculum mannosilyticum]
MELYVFNPQLNFLGVIDTFSSLRWRRKYYSTGEMELHCAVTSKNQKILAPENIIARGDAVESGVIEGVTMEDSMDGGETIAVTGRFLSSYFDRRIVHTITNISGTVEAAMRRLVNENCISPTDATRIIPLLELGTLNGFAEQCEFQVSYKNLLTYLENLSTISSIGFRVRADFHRKSLVFETYQGLDRSFLQSDRPRMMFSDEYDNLKSSTYQYNAAAYKNYALVGGEGEGNDRIMVSIGDAQGLDRRELWVDAKSNRADGITDDEYRKILAEAGAVKLAESVIVENMEATIEETVGQGYRTKWDLGDIVSCGKQKWDIAMTVRITEIEEIYENGVQQIVPVLGTPYPDKIEI